jgi:uncharacterized membrane protein
MLEKLIATVTRIKTTITLAAFAIVVSYLMIYHILQQEFSNNQLLITIVSTIVLFVILVLIMTWIEYLKGRGSIAKVNKSSKTKIHQKGKKDTANVSGSQDTTIIQG